MTFRLRSVWILMLKICMWGVIASIAWTTLSCDEFCEESNHTAVVADFYAAVGGTSITVNNIQIVGLNNHDSVLYPNPLILSGTEVVKNFSQVLLPVNPSVDTISFSIKNDALTADTITIYYTRHDGFISSECGCVTYADIREITTTDHSIKFIEITNESVNTVSYRNNVVNAENIRIYY